LTPTIRRVPHVELLDEAAIADLAVGATLLGTGGGGDPRIGELMARAAVREYGPVHVLSPADVGSDDLIVPVAMIGAPTVILERIPGGHELDATMAGIEPLLPRPVTATMPIEAGGINSTIPIVLAARRGLPLVDADGMGRAFPEVQLVTLGAGGASAWPLVLADEVGNTVAITSAAGNPAAERMARATVVAMGGSAIVAHYAVDGDHVREWAVPHTVSLAVAIGRAIRTSGHSGQDWIAALAELCGARRLFTGKVVDVDRATQAGFTRGRLSIHGLDDDAGSSAEVEFQNENLLLRADGQVLAAVPDLISLVDAETGKPYTTESMRYGLRVHVLGIPCSPIWWRPQALALVEPRMFGYDLDPVRLEAE
jgi:DUF917 family protein